MSETVTVVRSYKDTVFRLVFKEKKELLSLYNALNGSNYENEDELEVNTIEESFYMHIKNDVSFIFDFKINVFEHQSTVNPNMPIRALQYITTLYEKYIADNKMDIYSPKKITLPAPVFIVLYNGVVKQPEKKILKLSSLFEAETNMMELDIVQYNINEGYNVDLLNACKTLGDYAKFVAKIREYGSDYPLAQAANLAIEYCIEHGILDEFLKKYRSEVNMSLLTEFDEELHDRTLKSIGYEDGVADAQINAFMNCIQNGIDEKTAIEISGISAEVLERAKLQIKK